MTAVKAKERLGSLRPPSIPRIIPGVTKLADRVNDDGLKRRLLSIRNTPSNTKRLVMLPPNDVPSSEMKSGEKVLVIARNTERKIRHLTESVSLRAILAIKYDKTKYNLVCLLKETQLFLAQETGQTKKSVDIAIGCKKFVSEQVRSRKSIGLLRRHSQRKSDNFFKSQLMSWLNRLKLVQQQESWRIKDR